MIGLGQTKEETKKWIKDKIESHLLRSQNRISSIIETFEFKNDHIIITKTLKMHGEKSLANQKEWYTEPSSSTHILQIPINKIDRLVFKEKKPYKIGKEEKRGYITCFIHTKGKKDIYCTFKEGKWDGKVLKYQDRMDKVRYDGSTAIHFSKSFDDEDMRTRLIDAFEHLITFYPETKEPF
tara:strand:- start:144 stop:686 length:543 start_codon:yes stop_codon:yes gene_type:complete